MENKLKNQKLRSIPLKKEDKLYLGFGQIDGSHPWRQAVPGAYVDYQVRYRKHGKIVYFNFPLAKEMGIIAQEHEHKLNRHLENKISQTFAVQIINEYDIINKVKISNKDIKPNPYMATRYLQLQHKSKMGTTSGDGRSIWNGRIENNNTIWDISSCGTGVTKLSPGAVEAQKPIKTGSGSYSYGSGRAGVDEGVSSAILSEIFHRIGIPTERVLAVIEFPGNTAVNVRASNNLVRPSHLFNHLKQENLTLLTSGVDYFIERQIKNSKWPIQKSSPRKYDQLLEILTERYATFTAKLEHEYIFCWMDWDGDNMLANGAIIDYGSIRQFGLCHHTYRYDDDERMSTTLLEQKNKAKYIIQNHWKIRNG